MSDHSAAACRTAGPLRWGRGGPHEQVLVRGGPPERSLDRRRTSALVDRPSYDPKPSMGDFWGSAIVVTDGIGRKRAVIAAAIAAWLLALTTVVAAAGPAAGATSVPTFSPQLVRVATPDEKARTILEGLGLDLTEHARPGFREVVIYSPADLAALRGAGLSHRVRVADLVAESAKRRAADRRFARANRTTSLPSGRNTYRHLSDYEADLRALAEDHPKLVRHFTLPVETFEGRKLYGVEIAAPGTARKGLPAFAMLGLHHAREWPAGEHTIEWAYEVVSKWEAGSKRARKLLRRARVLVVPVVNPDGFNASREAGELQGAGDGRGGDDLTELANILTHPQEYRRKNCRLLTDTEAGVCLLQPGLGLVEGGVDLNRNYGGLWGGPGASSDPTQLDYRGPGPFSEPETRNVQHLLSNDQVTVMITNHTFSNLVLRPPGLASQGKAPDERAMKKLGAAMSAENGYSNQHGYQLYDTTGTTEDWSYYATGGYGYTFEIGPTNFHPPFADVVAEWRGTTSAAGSGGGNRAAFYKAWKAAGERSSHSIIRGRAPKAVKRIEISKRLATKTSSVIGGANDGEILEIDDVLRSQFRVRRGKFVAHVNPSTRPAAQAGGGRKPSGPPSPPVQFAGGPDTASPCADFDTKDPACFNDHPFRVPKSKKFDNESAIVRIEWATPVSDWDLKIYEDSDGDGSSAGEDQPLGTSGDAPTNSEQATATGLERGRRYVARVINYAAFEPYTGRIEFAGPPPPSAPGKIEKWTIRCLGKGDKAVGGRQLSIKRGKAKRIDLRRTCG